jgi:predicted Zn finger-like uncharacterized protein
MQVSCPKCRKHYNLADEKIGGVGVRVRCPSCGCTFNVQADQFNATTNIRQRRSGIEEEEPADGDGQPEEGMEEAAPPEDEPAVAAAEPPPLPRPTPPVPRRQEARPAAPAAPAAPQEEPREELPPPAAQPQEIFVSNSEVAAPFSDAGGSLGGARPGPARIPFRYAILPALVPLALFALYALFLHFPQLYRFRWNRTPVDALETAGLSEKGRALYLKAKFWQDLDDPQTNRRALALLDLALAENPDQLRLLGAKAELLASGSAPEGRDLWRSQAVDIALRVLARQPLSREALRALAHAFLGRDDRVGDFYLDQLMNGAYRGISEVADPETRWLLGRRQLRLGQLAPARANLEKAVELDPYLLRGYLDLAELAKLGGDPEGERTYRSLYATMRAKLSEKIRQEEAGK